MGAGRAVAVPVAARHMKRPARAVGFGRVRRPVDRLSCWLDVGLERVRWDDAASIWAEVGTDGPSGVPRGWMDRFVPGWWIAQALE